VAEEWHEIHAQQHLLCRDARTFNA
jgi:hypothetical protein